MRRIMFLLLSAFLLFFYSQSFFQLNGTAIPVFFAVLIFLMAGLASHGRTANEAAPDTALGMKAIAAVSFGAAVTFLLSTNFFGPVIAASIVGLSYAALAGSYESLKGLSRLVYCGAFVGMSADFFSMQEIILAGLLAGLIQMAPRKEYEGVGGIFGTIAFIATYLISKIFGD